MCVHHATAAAAATVAVVCGVDKVNRENFPPHAHRHRHGAVLPAKSLTTASRIRMYIVYAYTHIVHVYIA